jgi:hypothetical protein
MAIIYIAMYTKYEVKLQIRKEKKYFRFVKEKKKLIIYW